MRCVDWGWIKKSFIANIELSKRRRIGAIHIILLIIAMTAAAWIFLPVPQPPESSMISPEMSITLRKIILAPMTGLIGVIVFIPIFVFYLAPSYLLVTDVIKGYKEKAWYWIRGRRPELFKTLFFVFLLFPGVVGYLLHLFWWLLAKMAFSPRNRARVTTGMTGVIRSWRQKRHDPRLRALAAQEDRLRKELKAVRRGADGGELTTRIARNLSQIQELRTQILAEAESERQKRIRLHHEAKIEAAEAVIDEIRQLVEAEVVERQENGERLAAAYDEAEAMANGKALEELFQKQSS